MQTPNTELYSEYIGFKGKEDLYIILETLEAQILC